MPCMPIVIDKCFRPNPSAVLAWARRYNDLAVANSPSGNHITSPSTKPSCLSSNTRKGRSLLWECHALSVQRLSRGVKRCRWRCRGRSPRDDPCPQQQPRLLLASSCTQVLLLDPCSLAILWKSVLLHPGERGTCLKAVHLKDTSTGNTAAFLAVGTAFPLGEHRGVAPRPGAHHRATRPRLFPTDLAGPPWGGGPQGLNAEGRLVPQ